MTLIILISVCGLVMAGEGGVSAGGGGGDGWRLENAGRFTFSSLELIHFLRTQDLRRLPDLHLNLMEQAIQDPKLQIYSTDEQLYAIENGKKQAVDVLTFYRDKKIVYMRKIFDSEPVPRTRLTLLHELCRLSGQFDEGGSASRLYYPVIVSDFVKGKVKFNANNTVSYLGDEEDMNVPVMVKFMGRFSALLFGDKAGHFHFYDYSWGDLSNIANYESSPSLQISHLQVENGLKFCQQLGEKFVSSRPTLEPSDRPILITDWSTSLLFSGKHHLPASNSPDRPPVFASDIPCSQHDPRAQECPKALASITCEYKGTK